MEIKHRELGCSTQAVGGEVIVFTGATCVPASSGVPDGVSDSAQDPRSTPTPSRAATTRSRVARCARRSSTRASTTRLSDEPAPEDANSKTRPVGWHGSAEDSLRSVYSISPQKRSRTVRRLTPNLF